MPELNPLSGFGAPQAVLEVELRPAQINDRIIAYLFDTLPFVFGYHLCVSVVGEKIYALLGSRGVYLLAGAWIFLYVLYHWIGNLSGGSLGKKILGLAVVARDGGPLGAGKSLVRALGNVLSTPLANLGYILALFNAESRALHDFIAGSLVIESRAKSAGQSWLFFILSVTAVTGMFGGTIVLTYRAPTPSDLRKIAEAREGLKLLADIQEAYKAQQGTYADSLAALAQASGDADEFHDAISQLFETHRFEFKAGNLRYRITGAALDRRRTPVVIEGP